MRLEIVVFLVLLGIFLFWKFGRGSFPKFTLPKIDGSLINSNNWWSKRHEDIDKKRMFWYVVLAIVCALIVYLWDYQAAGIAAVIGLHAIWLTYYKKGNFLTKVIVSGILLSFVLGWLVPDTPKMTSAFWGATAKFLGDRSKEVTEELEAYKSGTSAAVTTSAKVGQAETVNDNYQQKQRRARTVEVIAEQGAFTEVKIPDLSNFDFVCPPGALMVIVHSGIPEGQVVDCDLQVKLALSSNLRGLRLGFQSKDSTPRHVTVTITSQS